MFVLCPFVGCGTQKNIRDNSVWARVKDNMKNISVDALINDYCTYNEYRDTILSFLGSVSFGDVPYSEIERYCNKSEVEDDLFYFFDSVRYEREMTVIDHLANLSFSELGKFYIDNHDALSFLKPMFQVSIVDELPDWDYPDVKMIRNCFFDTDFYPEIDSIYQLKRDVAIEKMMEDLDDYFTSEGLNTFLTQNFQITHECDH